jgi:hypothetical protein
MVSSTWRLLHLHTFYTHTFVCIINFSISGEPLTLIENQP